MTPKEKAQDLYLNLYRDKYDNVCITEKDFVSAMEWERQEILNIIDDIVNVSHKEEMQGLKLLNFLRFRIERRNDTERKSS